jgi:[ribosomal protein S5]-alanine N-acetyltransferase
MEIDCKDFKLRELRSEDAQDIAQNANNRKIWLNLRDAFPFPYTLENARFYIDLAGRQNPQCFFGIELERRIAGMISIIPGLDVYNISGEIGYWLAEKYWNRGIMTKAVTAMVNYGFQQLGLHRIHTGVFEYNTASMKVLEKAGFTREGIFRKAVKKAGVIVDEYRYAIILK